MPDSRLNQASVKSELRLQARESRESLTLAQQEHASESIIQHLIGHLVDYPAADQTIHLLSYRSHRHEVITDRLFASPPARCRMFAPRVVHEHMHWLEVTPETIWQTGAFNIPEPQNGFEWQQNDINILLCPLVGFDRSGNRLGMGKGFFDRWLADYRQHIDLLVGLAFACQELPAIPAEAHDIPLDAVITEKGWIPCHKSSIS